MRKPHFWAVMKAQAWSSITANGVPLSAPQEGPCRFIPLFKTKSEAVKFEHGSRKNIVKLIAT